jgi:hypothetical protein
LKPCRQRLRRTVDIEAKRLRIAAIRAAIKEEKEDGEPVWLKRMKEHPHGSVAVPVGSIGR